MKEKSVFWFYFISVIGFVAFYLAGLGRGTSETQRRWQKQAVDAGYARWHVASDGQVSFWWKTSQELQKSINQQVQP